MDKLFRFTILKRKIAPHLPVLAKVIGVIFTLAILFTTVKVIIRLIPPLEHWWRLRQTATSLLKDPSTILASSAKRTNVVILGKGGATHETPDLTDTIMLVSYHHQTGAITLISLPRDLWIDSLKAKINTAYYYGNQKKSGGGLILAKAAVEEVVNQPIHYVAVIDFDGFKNVINLVEGIEIDVPQTFDDYKYPIPGKETAQPETDRYEHLHFEMGKEGMDGERALKYVRSRNSSSDQGTDFARSNRQQQVMVALQQKLLSTQTLLNPQKLSGLLNLATSSLETNIPPDAIPAIAKLAIQFDRKKLTNVNLEQYLINPPPQKYQGQWVLIGKDETWTQIQQYIQNLLLP